MTLPYTNRCQQPRLLKAGPNPLFALGPYQVYGQITHHTLTQLSFTGRGKPQETGLLDGCLEFFQGQKKAIIAKTSLREVESFLRTENHIPAFDPPALSPYFETIREQLLRTLTRAESPLVCTCFKVSYQTIEEELLAHLDLASLDCQTQNFHWLWLLFESGPRETLFLPRRHLPGGRGQAQTRLLRK